MSDAVRELIEALRVRRVTAAGLLDRIEIDLARGLRDEALNNLVFVDLLLSALEAAPEVCRWDGPDQSGTAQPGCTSMAALENWRFCPFCGKQIETSTGRNVCSFTTELRGLACPDCGRKIEVCDG